MTTKTYFTWNVNGLRAVHRKGFAGWLQQTRPDVLGLQEIKCMPEQLTAEQRQPDGYHVYFAPAERKGYSGTAIYSRAEPEEVHIGIGISKFDAEGRTLTAVYPDRVFITSYVPSGGREGDRFAFKLEYLEALQSYCQTITARYKKPLIVCGDINIAHTERDLARPKQNKRTIGFLPEERAWIDRFLADGYDDALRIIHPERNDLYSWWSYRKGVRKRNIGWRLDSIFTSKELRPLITGCIPHSGIYGSDHCPVSVTLKQAK